METQIFDEIVNNNINGVIALVESFDAHPFDISSDKFYSACSSDMFSKRRIRKSALETAMFLRRDRIVRYFKQFLGKDFEQFILGIEHLDSRDKAEYLTKYE